MLAEVMGLLGRGRCVLADSDVLSSTPSETLSPFTRNSWANQRPAIQIVFDIVVVQIAILMTFRIQKRKRAQRSPHPINVMTKAQGLGLTINRLILSMHGAKVWCGNNAGGRAVFGFSLPTLERRGAWTN